MAIIKDYIAWVEKATAEGFYLGGQKLAADTGKIVSKTDRGFDVHDSPFAEASEILGGFMIIEAKDYDSAIAQAKAHPHLVHNRQIEIRQIDDVE